MTAATHQPSASGTRARANYGIALWLGALALSLPILSAISPINHDETQYIAAAYFAEQGLLPYRDFLHLQTPYQAYLYAPLFSASPEQALLGARILTSTCGIATLALAYLCLIRLRVTHARAAICCSLMYLCHTFVFGVTLVRNDALPAMLLAGAMLLLLGGLNTGASDRGSRRWLWAGCLLGLAIGTKVTYVLPAGTVLAFPLLAVALGRLSPKRALGTLCLALSGLLLTLLPLLAFRSASPTAFDYGVLGYHGEAPFAWYAWNGLAERLTLTSKLRDVLFALLRGPALFALVLYASGRIQSVRNGDALSLQSLLIDLLVLAGLLATCVPTPTWRQYAMPLLPPLFVGLGQVWQQQRGCIATRPKLACALLGFGALVGLAQPAFQIYQGTIGGQVSPRVVAAEGQQLAREAKKRGLQGASVSLSPEIVLTSGLPLDRAFATGPFAYRTGQLLSREERETFHTTSPESIAEYLSQLSPDTIVTGYENFDHVDLQGLEEPIEAFARSHHYLRLESSVGDAVFWFRPPSSALSP